MTSHQGVFISYYTRTRHAAIDITVLLDSGDCPDLNVNSRTFYEGLNSGNMNGQKLDAFKLRWKEFTLYLIVN